MADTFTNSSLICDCAKDEIASSSFTIPYPGDYIVVLILICLSAAFSGLNLGLLSLDKVGLQIVMGGGDKQTIKYAKAILPVRERGNLLLCTLLLGNVAVNSLVSILLADMTSGVVGFVASTALIVLFGEIVPQSACSRYPLKIGFYSLPLVKIFIMLFFIIAYPLSKALDFMLGADMGTIHSKRELRTMLEIHVQRGAVDIESGGVIDGALKYKDMRVSEIVTPRDSVFMVSVDDRLNYQVNPPPHITH
jgi:metal transporter CNNM